MLRILFRCREPFCAGAYVGAKKLPPPDDVENGNLPTKRTSGRDVVATQFDMVLHVSYQVPRTVSLERLVITGKRPGEDTEFETCKYSQE